MHFSCKQTVAPLMAHGFAKIWSVNIGMSESKEAFIAIVEGKKEIRLVVCFSGGEHKFFQLSDNIKNVVLRSYGEYQNHLHLTFQDNSFLFVENLSCTDAQLLKMSLDKVYQNQLQPPSGSARVSSVFTSKATWNEVNKSSFTKVREKSRSPSSRTKERNGTPDLQNMPMLKTQKSPKLSCKELLENQRAKRKRKTPSGSECETISKETKSTRKKNVRPNEKKELKLKEQKKLGINHSFKIDSTGKLYIDDTHLLQALSKKIYLTFLLESKCPVGSPVWEGLENTFRFYPEKLWHGLPNLGNTCYMNAVLQSLFSIPSFASDLLSHNSLWNKFPLDALSMCLVQLLVLKNIYNIKIKELLLENIKKNISAVAEIFSGNIQNDAHEFLGQCLDQMKEAQKLRFSCWKAENKSTSKKSSPQVWADSAATNMPGCPITANFEFELLCSIICKACGHVVLKTELNNYLSINLPQGPRAHPLSIQSAFDLFFEAEELEYKCEKCEHKCSIAVHKFSRLPRVLIVHLKRYNFSDFWSLKKDNQEVVISKYLKLSSHCTESTKSPLPLNKNIPVRDFQVLRVLQQLNFEAFCLSKLSKKLRSKFNNSLASYIGFNKKPEPQKSRTFCKRSSRKQKQKNLKKYLLRSSIESKLINTEDTSEEEPLSTRLMMDQESSSHPLICTDKDKLNSNPSAYLAEVHLQEDPENPKPKQQEKNNVSIDTSSEDVPETAEDFHEEKNRKRTKQKQQLYNIMIYKQALQQALLQSLSQFHALWLTENFETPTELSPPEAKVTCSENPGNKVVSDEENREAKDKEPERNAEIEDSHPYRLIGVVSHLGKTPHAGHYMSDAYDFQRKVWFAYDDLHVYTIQEALMQEARLCTGYIFFYMHNEIFEETLRREKSFRPRNREAEETPKQ